MHDRGGLQLTLSDGAEVPVSRSRRSADRTASASPPAVASALGHPDRWQPFAACTTRSPQFVSSLPANPLGARAAHRIMPAKEPDMRMRTIVPGFITALLLAPSRAAEPSAPLLVDAEWLAQHLTDRDLVVLHVGDHAEYRTEHIPGARLITEEDVSRPHDHSNLKDMMLELPDAATLRAKICRARHLRRQPHRRLFRQGRRRAVGDAHRLHPRLPGSGIARRRCSTAASRHGSAPASR